MTPRPARSVNSAALAVRWLNRDAAAAYTGMRSPQLFLRAVRAGKLPEPSRALGPKTPRWDRTAIDAVMTGGAEPDIQAATDGVAGKISAAGQARLQAREMRRAAELAKLSKPR